MRRGRRIFGLALVAASLAAVACSDEAAEDLAAPPAAEEEFGIIVVEPETTAFADGSFDTATLVHPSASSVSEDISDQTRRRTYVVPAPIGEIRAYFEGLGVPLIPLGSARFSGVLSVDQNLITVAIAEIADGTEVVIVDGDPAS